jgi:hypothetical protein
VAAPTSLVADYLDLGRVTPVFAVIAAEVVAVYGAMTFLVTAFPEAHFSPPGTDVSFDLNASRIPDEAFLSRLLLNRRPSASCNSFR